MTQRERYATSRYWLMLGDAIHRVNLACDHAMRNPRTPVHSYMMFMGQAWRAIENASPVRKNAYGVTQVLGQLENAFDAFDKAYNRGLDEGPDHRRRK